MSEPRPATMPRTPWRDAAHYWERRRIPYNVALALLAAGWVVRTWPHFRPAFNLPDLGRLLVLVLLANLCYGSAYLVDLPLQESPWCDEWLRRRWLLWLAGTLFALVVEYYWIGDEIYPSVGPR